MTRAQHKGESEWLESLAHARSNEIHRTPVPPSGGPLRGWQRFLLHTLHATYSQRAKFVRKRIQTMIDARPDALIAIQNGELKRTQEHNERAEHESLSDFTQWHAGDDQRQQP